MPNNPRSRVSPRRDAFFNRIMPSPDLETMLALFPPPNYLRTAEPVDAAQVPEPYRTLLVHEHHMTVTVEEHHRGHVNVVVLDKRRDGDSYARKILLALDRDGKIVQFGLVRINLAYCSAEVHARILAQKSPLGRILIEHNVLRRIEPTAYLRVTPGQEMMDWFGIDTPEVTYGRLALIHCDGKPAIELLEIVAPEPSNPVPLVQ
jgi:chorismate-pyruvate lyase